MAATTPGRRRGVFYLAAWIVMISCLAPLTVAAPVAVAQGEEGASQPETTGKSADEGSGSSEEGSSEEDSGEEGSGDEDSSEEGSGEGPGSEESANGSEDSSGSTGAMSGLATGFFNTIGTHIWDWTVGSLGEKIANNIGDSLLYLPDPSADEQVTGVYEDVKRAVQGLLVVGIIVMSLAMIVRSANTGLQFSGLKVLPRILGVAIVLGALPSLFGVLSTLGTDLTVALMPNDGQIDQAKVEMTKAIAGNLVITNFLNLILALAGIYVLFILIIVALLKAIVYVLLFIIAPFPLIGSLIPGFEKFAVIWAKAVLVTAFIPAIWATELWIGAILINIPETLFGEMVNTLGFLTNGMFTTIIAIGMFYLIYKTPFVAMSWAIPSYEPSRGGGLMSFGSLAAKAAMSAGIKSAVGGAIGGLAGGAAAAKGSQSDAPRGERPSMDSLGGKMRENKRRTTTTTTDSEGNQKTSYREEHTVEASRDRIIEHDELQQHFNRGGDNGPGGSPLPPKTQTVNSGGRGGRLNRGDRSRNDEGFDQEGNKRGDRNSIRDRGEEE